MNASIWQLLQSINTKAENLENDFNEIAATIWEMGWGQKKTRFGLGEEEESSGRWPGFARISLDVVGPVVCSVVQVSGPFMESIFALVIEWMPVKRHGQAV